MADYIITSNGLHSTDELKHYGVLGMKWGVRRYQNPDGTLTAAGRRRYAKEQYEKDWQANNNAYAKSISKLDAKYEKRMSTAKTEKDRDKIDREWIDAVEKHDADWNKDHKLKSKKEYIKEVEREYKESANDDSGLNLNQKKALAIGAAAIGVGLAAYGAYKFSKFHRGAGLPIDPATGFRLLKNSADADDLMKINPGLIRWFGIKKNKQIINGSRTNCMLCTTAYELRKRGFDVRAGLELNKTGYLADDLFPNLFKDYKGTTKISPPSDFWEKYNKWFNDPDVDVLDPKWLRSRPRWSSESKLASIESFIKNEGPGSRGNIMVWWDGFGRGGHSMIWENVDGKVVFKDGQTGEVYKNFKKILDRTADGEGAIEMLRTDNLELNTSDIKNFINSDTTIETYTKHGKEVAISMATDPVVLTGTSGALYYGARRSSINNYKKEHPNTKLSDKEIAKLLTKQ